MYSNDYPELDKARNGGTAGIYRYQENRQSVDDKMSIDEFMSRNIIEALLSISSDIDYLYSVVISFAEMIGKFYGDLNFRRYTEEQINVRKYKRFVSLAGSLKRRIDYGEFGRISARTSTFEFLDLYFKVVKEDCKKIGSFDTKSDSLACGVDDELKTKTAELWAKLFGTHTTLDNPDLGLSSVVDYLLYLLDQNEQLQKNNSSLQNQLDELRAGVEYNKEQLNRLLTEVKALQRNAGNGAEIWRAGIDQRMGELSRSWQDKQSELDEGLQAVRKANSDGLESIRIYITEKSQELQTERNRLNDDWQDERAELNSALSDGLLSVQAELNSAWKSKQEELNVGLQAVQRANSDGLDMLANALAEGLNGIRSDIIINSQELREERARLNVELEKKRDRLGACLDNWHSELDEGWQGVQSSLKDSLTNMRNQLYGYFEESKADLNGELQIECKKLKDEWQREKENLDLSLKDVESAQSKLGGSLQGMQSKLESDLQVHRENLEAQVDKRVAEIKDRVVPVLVSEQVRQVVQENPQLYNEKAEELLNSLDSIPSGDRALNCSPEAIVAFGRLFASLVNNLQKKGLKISAEDENRRKIIYEHFRRLASALNTNINNADSLAMLLRERLRYGFFSSIPGDIRQQIMKMFADIFTLARSDDRFGEIGHILLSEGVVSVLKDIGCEIVNPKRGDFYDSSTMIDAKYGDKGESGRVVSCIKPGVVWRLADGKVELGFRAEVLL